jgi:hypothetical protein
LLGRYSLRQTDELLADLSVGDRRRKRRSLEKRPCTRNNDERRHALEVQRSRLQMDVRMAMPFRNPASAHPRSQLASRFHFIRGKSTPAAIALITIFRFR